MTICWLPIAVCTGHSLKAAFPTNMRNTVARTHGHIGTSTSARRFASWIDTADGPEHGQHFLSRAASHAVSCGGGSLVDSRGSKPDRADVGTGSKSGSTNGRTEIFPDR